MPAVCADAIGSYARARLGTESLGPFIAYAPLVERSLGSPIWPAGLAGSGGWRDTSLELPPGNWTDQLTGRGHSGGNVAVAELLHRYPVALLARES